MTVVETLIPAALRLGRDEFLREHAGYHLLKPPSQAAGIPYTTLVAEEEELDPSFIVPSSDRWQATPIVKRPGNPYPNRISVGRAKNCDVVLRFPEVSKLHAHFMRSDDLGPLKLLDLGSVNGTEHNGRRVAEGEVVSLASGDALTFGGIHCRLLDAGDLFELVVGNGLPSTG